MSFFGATGTPVLDFWWRLLWVSKPEWAALFALRRRTVMYIPWDPPLVLHLPTSWRPARSRSCPHILLQRWGCWDSNSCSQNICEPDALPTELKPGSHIYAKVMLPVIKVKLKVKLRIYIPPLEPQGYQQCFTSFTPWQRISPNLGVSHHLEVMRQANMLHPHTGLAQHLLSLHPSGPNFTPWCGEAVISDNLPNIVTPLGFDTPALRTTGLRQSRTNGFFLAYFSRLVFDFIC